MKQRTLQQIVKQVICLCMVSIVLAPILLTLFAAFKTKADMVNTSPLLLPPLSRVTTDNFQKVLGDKYGHHTRFQHFLQRIIRHHYGVYP